MLKASQAKQLFIVRYGTEKNLLQELRRDYFAVQLAWECFMDSLCRNGTITNEQYNNWLFPWKGKLNEKVHVYP